MLRRVLIHVGLWGAVTLLLLLPAGSSSGEPRPWSERLAEASLVLGLAVPPVYLHFLIFERCFLRRRHLMYLALLGAGTMSYAATFNAVVAVWPGRQPGIVYTSVIILVFVLVSSAIKAFGEVGRQRLLLEEARAKQLRAELDLLRAQVHPHLLFNTLNNLFGLARKGDPTAADGIARLSHLLRYMIYDSAVERIDLEKEIEQIRRLIELEKLRFSPGDDIRVDLSVEGDPSGTRIPPMLLFPFVENAFKHGVDLTAPSFVRIALRVSGGTLRFTVTNSVHAVGSAAAGRDPEPGRGPGVGLQNVIRRLELLYPGAHRLAIDEAGGAFTVDLTLDPTSQGGSA